MTQTWQTNTLLLWHLKSPSMAKGKSCLLKGLLEINAKDLNETRKNKAFQGRKMLEASTSFAVTIYVPFEFDRINLNKQQDGRLNVSCYDGFFGDSISWLAPQETKSIATWIQCFLRRNAVLNSQLPVYIYFNLKEDKCPLKKKQENSKKKITLLHVITERRSLYCTKEHWKGSVSKLTSIFCCCCFSFLWSPPSGWMFYAFRPFCSISNSIYNNY